MKTGKVGKIIIIEPTTANFNSIFIYLYNKLICNMRYILFCLLLMFSIITTSQNISDLQHKTVVFAPLRDSSCLQSVYWPDALVKNKFNSECLANINVYGVSVFIDSIYTVFSNNKKKHATIIEMNTKDGKALYHFPLYFDRTNERQSFMYHYSKLRYELSRNHSKFNKSSTYSKNFGTTERLTPDDISFIYYDFKEIQHIDSTYKDSIVTLILTKDKYHPSTKQNNLENLILDAQSFEFVFKGLQFQKDPNISLYKDEGVYPLCIVLQSLKTSKIFYLPIATTSDTRYLSINEIPNFVKRRHDYIQQLTKTSEMFKSISRLIGCPVYIKDPQLLNHYSIKWWYTPISIYQYSKNAIENQPIGWDSFIDCILNNIVTHPNVLNPTPWELGKGRRTDTLGIYQCYAKVLPNPSRKDYDKIKSDTLLIPIGNKSLPQIWESQQFDSLVNIREHEADMVNQVLQLSEEFNLSYAKSQWGEDEVDRIVYKRQVKFGYTTEMCLMAYRGQEYKVSFVFLPIGRAKRYHFLENDIKLYFINDTLIGIQFPMEDIVYE